jgi:hypothetical protein
MEPRILKLTVECSKAEFFKIMGPNYLEKYWVGKQIIKFDSEVKGSFTIKEVSYQDSLIDNQEMVVILVEYELGE